MKPVTLTRKVSFSSGHRYWDPTISESENKALFGPWASPFNHGHNYVLYCSITGQIDTETGMVVNIKHIDQILQNRVVHVFDQKSINDEVEGFQQKSPCLENIVLHIVDSLGEISRDFQITNLRLEEMPELYVELNLVEKKMTITRSYEFAASHRLHSPELSDAENLELFGKCNNAAGHGHNYIVEVTVSGSPDPKTGFLIDIGALDAVVNSQIIERYDHKNLNCDVAEFEGKNPTSEVVALAIWEKLNGVVPGTLEKISLQETARNIFEVCRG